MIYIKTGPLLRVLGNECLYDFFLDCLLIKKKKKMPIFFLDIGIKAYKNFFNRKPIIFFFGKKPIKFFI